MEVYPLFDNGKPCTLDQWLRSPERVLKTLRRPMTAIELNRFRWGSPVDVRVDVEELKECKRRGLVTYDRETKKWEIAK